MTHILGVNYLLNGVVETPRTPKFIVVLAGRELVTNYFEKLFTVLLAGTVR